MYEDTSSPFYHDRRRIQPSWRPRANALIAQIPPELDEEDRQLMIKRIVNRESAKASLERYKLGKTPKGKIDFEKRQNQPVLPKVAGPPLTTRKPFDKENVSKRKKSVRNDRSLQRVTKPELEEEWIRSLQYAAQIPAPSQTYWDMKKAADWDEFEKSKDNDNFKAFFNALTPKDQAKYMKRLQRRWPDIGYVSKRIAGITATGKKDIARLIANGLLHPDIGIMPDVGEPLQPYLAKVEALKRSGALEPYQARVEALKRGELKLDAAEGEEVAAVAQAVDAMSINAENAADMDVGAENAGDNMDVVVEDVQEADEEMIETSAKNDSVEENQIEDVDQQMEDAAPTAAAIAEIVAFGRAKGFCIACHAFGGHHSDHCPRSIGNCASCAALDGFPHFHACPRRGHGN